MPSFFESVVFDLKLVHLTFFGEVSSFLEGRVGQGQEDWSSSQEDWTVAVGGTKNLALFDVIVNYMLFLRCRWCIKDLHIVQGGARFLTLSSSGPHRQSRWC